MARALFLKSENSPHQIKFKVHDYGGNKGGYWGLVVRLRQFVQVGHSDYSEFDKEGNKTENGQFVHTEEQVWGLGVKELDRLIRWAESAKKALAKIEARKKDW